MQWRRKCQLLAAAAVQVARAVGSTRATRSPAARVGTIKSTIGRADGILWQRKTRRCLLGGLGETAAEHLGGPSLSMVSDLQHWVGTPSHEQRSIPRNKFGSNTHTTTTNVLALIQFAISQVCPYINIVRALNSILRVLLRNVHWEMAILHAHINAGDCLSVPMGRTDLCARRDV
jgi:hypothetical protein